MNHLHCHIYSRDEDYLRDIRAGGPRAERAISCLYLKYRQQTHATIQKMVDKHGEFKGVPEDLLHDSFIVLLEKIRENAIQIKTLAGFWAGIGKHLLLNQLKKDQRIILVNDLDEVYENYHSVDEWMICEDEENDLLSKAFSKLGPRCREILLLWINQYTLTEITQLMKFTSIAMTRKTKYECFKKLKDLVRTGYISGG